jgi:hypothetical protein
MLLRLVRLPYIVFFAAPVVILLPVLIPGKALFWGTPMLQFIPWRALAWEILQSGNLPSWNPLVGMGAPLIANYQSALFYPPNWSYFIMAYLGGVELLAWWQGWLAVAHLAWAALGMAALTRKLGLDTLSQTVSGLAFGLSGYLVARAGFLSINAAVAWLPWILVGLTGRKMSARNVLYLGLCIGMLLLAGHAQTAWYVLLLSAAWSAFWASRASDRAKPHPKEGTLDSWIRARGGALLRWTARAWGLLALGAGLGAMMAAVQLLPTAEYLLQSQRAAAVDYEAAMTYSFWPWRLFGLVAPGMFGSPASGDYWGYGNYWEDAIYVGLLPFLLALKILLRSRTARKEAGQRQERDSDQRGSTERGSAERGRDAPLFEDHWLVAFLAATILVSFLLALGKNLPLFPWLYRTVPTFDMFQSPARFSIWAVFALALLAGMGVQAWRRPEGRGLYWTRLGTMAAAAITLGAGVTAAAAPFGLGEIKPTAIRAFALMGVWGLGIGLLTLTAPERRSGEKVFKGRSWWKCTVVGLLAADLVLASWGLNPAVEVNLFRPGFPLNAQLQTGQDSGRIYLPPADEDEIKFKRFLRFDTFFPDEGWESLRSTLLPDIHMLSGIPSANNFDPLVPSRYARWMESLAASSGPARERMLDLMAVTAVERADPEGPDGVRFLTRTALPRLRWVPCAISAGSPEEALGKVQEGEFMAGWEVILEDATGASVPACPAVSEPGSASLSILLEEANRISLEVKSGADGYLVLADVWYPGWQAWVDGDPVPIHKANYLFRAVSVPEGEHRVDIAYRPASLYLGALISGIAWAGVAYGSFRGSLSRRWVVK